MRESGGVLASAHAHAQERCPSPAFPSSFLPLSSSALPLFMLTTSWLLLYCSLHYVYLFAIRSEAAGLVKPGFLEGHFACNSQRVLLDECSTRVMKTTNPYHDAAPICIARLVEKY